MQLHLSARRSDLSPGVREERAFRGEAPGAGPRQHGHAHGGRLQVSLIQQPSSSGFRFARDERLAFVACAQCVPRLVSCLAKGPLDLLRARMTFVSSSLWLVFRFYDFWERFESWRDFSLKAAEHNLDEAESREEKRWMMKENEKR